jgi:hypothetical protein
MNTQAINLGGEGGIKNDPGKDMVPMRSHA